MQKYNILETLPSEQYELIDSGDGEKLERYGDVLVSRPDPQALWKKNLSDAEWNKADAFFQRDSNNAQWQTRKKIAERWKVTIQDLSFWIKLSAFKHTGVFPEQVPNWAWIEEKIIKAKRQVSVLNLFGYTGGASLAAAKAGAEVCHVDGSKTTVGWARENAEISGLSQKPIRWIVDDASSFVKREIKRGRKYDAVIMDPPAFGHGPKGEVWKIEENLIPFIDECKSVLSDKPLFFIINGYASGYSAIAYKNDLESVFKLNEGYMELGELTIKESGSGRLLPSGIFARWSSV